MYYFYCRQSRTHGAAIQKDYSWLDWLSWLPVNLLNNIPQHTHAGLAVRDPFIPDAGHTLDLGVVCNTPIEQPQNSLYLLKPHFSRAVLPSTPKREYPHIHDTTTNYFIYSENPIYKPLPLSPLNDSGHRDIAKPNIATIKVKGSNIPIVN